MRIIDRPDLPWLYGWLHLVGWHGHTAQRIIICGETPHRRRIRAITRTRLARPGHWLEPGEMALVPATSVQIDTVAGLVIVDGVIQRGWKNQYSTKAVRDAWTEAK